MSTGSNSPCRMGCAIQYTGERCLIQSTQGARCDKCGAPGARPEGRHRTSRCSTPHSAAAEWRERQKCAAQRQAARRANRYRTM